MTTDYKFNIGDEVITTEGERGRIVYICECSRCKDRGFCEPRWVKDGDTEDQYITNYAAETGFKEFYRIGQYRFSEFRIDRLTKEIVDHEKEIARLRKRLAVIKEIQASESAAKDLERQGTDE